MTKKRAKRSPFTFEDLLQAEDVHAVVRALGRSPTGVRNATLVTLLWRSGLRIQEALDLLIRDVDFKTRVIRVRSGKNDVARDVPIDDRTLERLQHWLDLRTNIVGSTTQAIFCTRGAKKMTQRYARRMMSEAAKQGGLTRPVYPHALRHLYAGELQREGVPIAVIRKLLGHASSKTTAEYLERCSRGEEHRAIASRPDWRGFRG